MYLLIGYLGIQRERKAFLRCSFRKGEIAFFVAQLNIGLLAMEGDRVVNRRGDAISGQKPLQRGAMIGTHNKKMVNMMS